MYLNVVPYNREAVFDYTTTWAYSRNPAYLDFSELGGDCTNFASQSIYAGSGVMNYSPEDLGWYYNSSYDRAPSWTGVKFLHRFLLNNKGVGPFGEVADVNSLEVGDIIFLGDGEKFYHSLVVVGNNGTEPLVAAHTYDSYMRPLSNYEYPYAEGVHILGVRK